MDHHLKSCTLGNLVFLLRERAGDALGKTGFAIFGKAHVSSVKDTWYTRAKKTPKLSKRYEFLSLAHIVLS